MVWYAKLFSEALKYDLQNRNGSCHWQVFAVEIKSLEKYSAPPPSTPRSTWFSSSNLFSDISETFKINKQISNIISYSLFPAAFYPLRRFPFCLWQLLCSQNKIKGLYYPEDVTRDPDSRHQQVELKGVICDLLQPVKWSFFLCGASKQTRCAVKIYLVICQHVN